MSSLQILLLCRSCKQNTCSLLLGAFYELYEWDGFRGAFINGRWEKLDSLNRKFMSIAVVFDVSTVVNVLR